MEKKTLKHSWLMFQWLLLTIIFGAKHHRIAVNNNLAFIKPRKKKYMYRVTEDSRFMSQSMNHDSFGQIAIGVLRFRRR